jgi:hypothetical protein
MLLLPVLLCERQKKNNLRNKNFEKKTYLMKSSKAFYTKLPEENYIKKKLQIKRAESRKTLN